MCGHPGLKPLPRTGRNGRKPIGGSIKGRVQWSLKTQKGEALGPVDDGPASGDDEYEKNSFMATSESERDSESGSEKENSRDEESGDSASGHDVQGSDWEEDDDAADRCVSRQVVEETVDDNEGD
jgi:hypothetical protein